MNGNLTYTPEPGFTGDDTGTYRAYDDAQAMSDWATVTITVEPADTTPPVEDPDPDDADPTTADQPTAGELPEVGATLPLGAIIIAGMLVATGLATLGRVHRH